MCLKADTSRVVPSFPNEPGRAVGIDCSVGLRLPSVKTSNLATGALRCGSGATSRSRYKRVAARVSLSAVVGAPRIKGA
jgi:hypothetical protein